VSQAAPTETPRPAGDGAEGGSPRLLRAAAGLRQLLRPLSEGVMPQPRLLKDEQVQLTIRMAPYRLKTAQSLFWIGAFSSLIAGVLYILARILSWLSIVQLAIIAVALLFVASMFGAWQQMLLYHQWQCLITNKRLIIIAPDPARWGFADIIYLKGGKVQVVDTNWSSSPWWGLFQSTTGARDVVLSLSGYEFKPSGVEVKGGLRFPDVMPDDIVKLEELVFG